MSRPDDAFDAAAHFDEASATRYDRRIRSFCPSYDALHHMTTAWLSRLPERAEFLSAGAGTGAEILALGSRFPLWRFTAVEVSIDMMTACRNRVAAAGMAERVAYFQGRVQEFRSATSFDAASSIFVSHFIAGREEKLAYFRAISSLLKPGGSFILADLFGDRASSEFGALLDAWLASYASHGVAAPELEKDRAHIENDIAFVSESELLELLHEAGFDAPIRFYQTFLFGGWMMTKRV
ncbi:methyltransferase type 12 [Methylosinus sp. R-45379]|uniref:class I SAM-dependent methyltransferase n=1 Tax=unclassified Methylosinus TaxID=2624500 RepID=UPI000467A9D8|nr:MULTISPECIES: class I SAM-dependent methyltransferase [unclassified Methylosinus]OAI29284.1 methyltransferase type 12 [Methylosinus sp. R-45379]TDX63107.1 tRNA (cmo5U34)-methyltransferase [Methylosinus sp. sav-2]